LLDEPWARDARGVELQYLLARDADGREFNEVQWAIWSYKDAVTRADEDAAERARAELRALDGVRSHDSWLNPEDQYFQLVWSELEFRNIDHAADDLVYWLSVSSADDVENNKSNRTNCRQVIFHGNSILRNSECHESSLGTKYQSRLPQSRSRFISHLE